MINIHESKVIQKDLKNKLIRNFSNYLKAIMIIIWIFFD